MLRDSDNNLQQPHYYFLYENARDTHPWKYALVSRVFVIFIHIPSFVSSYSRSCPVRPSSSPQSLQFLSAADLLSSTPALKSSSPSVQPLPAGSSAATRSTTSTARSTT